MNILPVVVAFLVILSCINATFFRDTKSFHLLEQTIRGYQRAERALSNTIAQRAYKKVKAEPTAKTQKGDKQTQPNVKFTSRRSLFPPLENSKFNLTPLILASGECKLHPLYEPLAELLRKLYATKVFQKYNNSEKLPYRLIDEIVKKARKLSTVDDLAQLYPDDPMLQQVYYKMLRGTNQYKNGEGFPPLKHFLSLNKSEKAISLSFSSPPVLEALFGTQMAAEILKLEREKWNSSQKYYLLTKEDLQPLLMKNPAKSSVFTALDTYLDYSKQFAQRTEVGGKDKITGITVEKRL